MTIETLHLSASWQPRRLILSHLLVITLILSLFSGFWEPIDTAFFRFLNDPLANSSSLRTFWAVANHRLADWFEDMCIGIFYVLAIIKTRRGQRTLKGAQLAFTVLFATVTLLLINRFLCRDLLKLRRDSPTLTLDGAVTITDYIQWIQVKVDSTKSFPGDHATTALFFGLSYAHFVRGKLATCALIYSLLLCLPRLAVGAHWLSDIICGSGSLVLFALSWAFFTPLATEGSTLLYKAFKKIGKSLT